MLFSQQVVSMKNHWLIELWCNNLAAIFQCGKFLPCCYLSGWCQWKITNQSNIQFNNTVKNIDISLINTFLAVFLAVFFAVFFWQCFLAIFFWYCFLAVLFCQCFLAVFLAVLFWQCFFCSIILAVFCCCLSRWRQWRITRSCWRTICGRRRPHIYIDIMPWQQWCQIFIFL